MEYNQRMARLARLSPVFTGGMGIGATGGGGTSPPPPPAGWSIPQSTSNSIAATTSATLAYTQNVTSGNLSVLAFATSQTTSISSLTDTVGTTYASIIAVSPIGFKLWLYAGLFPSSGPNTVTLALGFSSQVTIAIHEYSHTAGIPSVYNSNSEGAFDNTASTAMSTAPVPISGSTQLVFAAFAQGLLQALTSTPGTGWTARQSQQGGVAAYGLYTQDDYPVSAQVTPSATLSSNAIWGGVAAAFLHN